MSLIDSFMNGLGWGIGKGIGNTAGDYLLANGWMPTVLLIIGALLIASLIRKVIDFFD